MKENEFYDVVSAITQYIEEAEKLCTESKTVFFQERSSIAEINSKN